MDIGDVIPIVAIEDDLLLTRRGEYGYGFLLQESEVFSTEQSDVKKIHDVFCQILNMLPSWTVLHKQDWYLETSYKMNTTRTNDFISQSYEMAFHEKPFIKHHAYLYFIKSTRNGQSHGRLGSILNSRMLPQDLLNKEQFQKFEASISAVEDYINSTGLMSLKRLRKADYIGEAAHPGLFDHYLNLNEAKEITDIALKKDLKVGEKHCRYFSVPSLECYPKSVRHCDSNNNYKFPFSFLYNVGLGAKCNHILNLIIFKDDVAETRAKIETKLNGVTRWLSASTENVDNAQEIRNFLQEANTGRTVVRAHLNTVTWADTHAKLKNNELIINSALTGLGFLPKRETLDEPYLHWAGFPGNGSDIPKDLTATVFADVAACLVTNETNYVDSISDFGMKLTPRGLGVPVHTDFTVEPKAKGIIFNYHKIGVGYSGGGKTVFCAEYLRNRILSGGHVVAVDVGRSYNRLAQLLGKKAQHFEYTSKKPLAFNPFYIKDGEDLDINKINLLIALILGICFGIDIDSENQTVKVQVAIMKRLIKGYYRKVLQNSLFPCMNTFYEFLQEEHQKMLQGTARKELEYLDLNALLIVLDEFYIGGIYEHVFNARENLDLTAIPFVLFDLDNIKEDKTLLSIVTTMIITVMMEKVFKMERVYGDDAAKIIKTIFFDEAWFALMIPRMAAYADWCVRTLRKHEGEFFPVTQNLNDFINNKFVQDVLLQNCPTKIIFDISGYKENAIKVCNLLGLTERETQQAQSLNIHIPSGVSAREVIIKNAHLTRIYTNILSKEQLALYTTDKADKELVDKMIEKAGGNVELGIKNYLETKKTA